MRHWKLVFLIGALALATLANSATLLASRLSIVAPAKASATLTLTVVAKGLVFVDSSGNETTAYTANIEQEGVVRIPMTVRNKTPEEIRYVFVSSVDDGIPLEVFLESNQYARVAPPLNEDTFLVVVLMTNMLALDAQYDIGIKLE